MQNRRELIWGSVAAASGVVFLASGREASAQRALPTYEAILNGEFEYTSALYKYMRSLSGFFINLRRIYNGPFGYEGEGDIWTSGAFEAWRVAFGNEADYESVRSRYYEFLTRDFSSIIADQMEAKLDEERDRFSGWCSEIGIVPESQLSHDLISSQAMMTLLYTQANEEEVREEGGLSFFGVDLRTWIWPFCGLWG